MSLSWGGYSNGQIPQNRLVQVGTSPVLHVPQYLEARAAKWFLAFSAAFRVQFGRDIDPVEGYRSLYRQQALYSVYRADPAHAALAALPGTSNHGWARAVDMGSGIASADTPEAHWARVNGPRYGFWPTGYDFSKLEPWHYDWRPDTATASLNVTPITEPQEVPEMASRPVIIANTESAGIFHVVSVPEGWQSLDTGEHGNAELRGLTKIITAIIGGQVRVDLTGEEIDATRGLLSSPIEK